MISTDIILLDKQPTPDKKLNLLAYIASKDNDCKPFVDETLTEFGIEKTEAGWQQYGAEVEPENLSIVLGYMFATLRSEEAVREHAMTNIDYVLAVSEKWNKMLEVMNQAKSEGDLKNVEAILPDIRQYFKAMGYQKLENILADLNYRDVTFADVAKMREIIHAEDEHRIMGKRVNSERSI